MTRKGSAEGTGAVGSGVQSAGVVIGLVASLVTIASLVLALKDAMTPEIVAVIVTVVTATFGVIIVYLTVRYERLRNQADAKVTCEEAKNKLAVQTLALVHDLSQDIASLRTQPNESQVGHISRIAVDRLARAFTENTGVDCRASVKQVLNVDKRTPSVLAIARSDRLKDSDRHPHEIANNTDFASLLSGERSSWFCNDIDNYPHYKSTSVSRGYKSTIVWPVLTRVAAEDLMGTFAEDGAGYKPIVAFLCLDSAVPGIFNEEQHVPLGWAVSDALARLYEAQRSFWEPDISIESSK